MPRKPRTAAVGANYDSAARQTDNEKPAAERLDRSERSFGRLCGVRPRRAWPRGRGCRLARAGGPVCGRLDRQGLVEGTLVLLASGSDDQTARLWSVPDGEPRGQLRGHTDMVQSLAFSADGSMLASGSEDFTIRLWAIDDLRPVGSPLRAEPGVVWALAAGPDGDTLVAGNRTKVVAWAFGEDGWTATACAFAGRELMLAAYRDAIARGFLFYSYGDAMLVQ